MTKASNPLERPPTRPPWASCECDMFFFLVMIIQHERDWQRNRHGLLLSFKDSAGRHYQVNVSDNDTRVHE